MAQGIKADPLVRFADFILIAKNGCWIFTGSTNKDGYGIFWNGNKTVLAHRFYWEQRMGKIPKDMTIDHTCQNTSCVNVQHMQIITRSENVRLQGARKTHCKHGHRFDIENTYIHPQRGTRHCKACAKERGRNHRKN